MSITAAWEWIPRWILTGLNWGQAYPEGDEDGMFALGDAWRDVARGLAELEPGLRAATDATQKFYTGGGAVQAAKQFRGLFEGDHSIGTTAKAMADLGAYARRGGTELEYTKMMQAAMAATTAYSAIALAAAWPWGSASVPFVLASGRTAVGFAASRGASKLAMQAAQAGLRNAVKPFLKQVGVAAAKEAAAEGGLDLAIQLVQLAEGHRDMRLGDGGIDLWQAGQNAFGAGVGTLLGAPAGIGAGKLFGRAGLPGPVADALSGAVQGAVGELGAYGADIGWQAGKELVDSTLEGRAYDGSRIDTTFDPSSVAAGAGLGGMGGARHGLQLGRDALGPVMDGSAPTTAPKPDMSPANFREVTPSSENGGRSATAPVPEPGGTGRSGSGEPPAAPIRSAGGSGDGSTPHVPSSAPSPPEPAASHTARDAAPVAKNPAGPAESGTRTAPPDRAGLPPSSERIAPTPERVSPSTERPVPSSDKSAPSAEKIPPSQEKFAPRAGTGMPAAADNRANPVAAPQDRDAQAIEEPPPRRAAPAGPPTPPEPPGQPPQAAAGDPDDPGGGDDDGRNDDATPEHRDPAHRAHARHLADAMDLAVASRTPDGQVDPDVARQFTESAMRIEVGAGSELLRADGTFMDFVVASTGRTDLTLALNPGGRGDGESGAPVYIVKDQAGDRVAIAKLFPESSDLLRELSSIHRLSDPEFTTFGVPDVTGVALVEVAGRDYGAFVMSTASGTRIVDMIRDIEGVTPATRPERMGALLDAVSDVGAALGELHSKPEGTGGPIEPRLLDMFDDQARDKTRELLGRPRALQEFGLYGDDIRDRVEELLLAGRTDPGPATLTHGDAQPGNVFWNGIENPGRPVTFIDNADVHPSMDERGRPIGAPAQDAARMVHQLERFGRLHGFGADEIADMLAAFTGAYDRAGGPPVPADAWQAFQVRMSLRTAVKAAKEWEEAGDEDEPDRRRELENEFDMLRTILGWQ